MNLAFDNEHFVAGDKPGGWLSVPSRLGDADPRPCVGRDLEKRLGQRLWPVHRLDEEVTGLLLFAKDAVAHGEASRWFEQHLVKKTYDALTEIPAGGAPPPRQQIWESRLMRGKKRAYEAPHGKPSVTRAMPNGVMAAGGATVLSWTLEPVTGRPHQLRYELSHRGFPVLGDELYGAKSPPRDGAIALRCVRLEFELKADVQRFGLPQALTVRGLDEWLAT